LTQLAFYLSAIAVAWLTYVSAKRGLLNTVNTEYQKRVIDRLADVSAGLWEEIGGLGDNLFYRFTVEVRERVEKINELWKAGERFETFE